MITQPSFPVQRVFLDLGHILFRLSYAETIQKIATQSGSSVEKVSSYFHYNTTHIAYETGRISSDVFFMQAANDLGFKGSLSDFRRIWLNLVSPIEENFSFARELATVYPIGVISNVGKTHVDDILKSTDLESFTDLRIYSFEAGIMKPDLGIYEMAISRAGIPAEVCVFIDDKIENVKAAISLGIRAYCMPEDACLRTFWNEHIA